jgi:hypothetical protein
MKLLLASALALSTAIAGCNMNDTGHPNPPPAVDDSASGGTRALPQGRTPDSPGASMHRGMSTSQKVVMLGGAAALYYMYKHHQSAAASQGPEGQYYLSKNGRVYYRDADHRAHWVTPPQEGIAVPETEARDYQQFQGYDNRQSGKDLTGLGSDSSQ